MFGDEDSVPVRAPLRERTEIAPSARDAPVFSPPGGQGEAAKPRYAADPSGYEPPQAAPQQPEPGAPRGRRRPAPRPRPNISGFDAGESNQDMRRPQRGAPDPAASSGNLPRPRPRAEANVSPSSGAVPRSPSSFSQSGTHGAPVQTWQGAQPPRPRAETGLRVVLVGRDGREGEAFPLPPSGIEIGRQGGISFPSDPFVSPRHARVQPSEGGVYVVDLGSRNGVYLRLTEPTPVYPGDLFLLGNQLLRLDRLEQPWQERALDQHEVRGFGTPVKPPWALLTRVCVGEIEDDRYHLRGTEMTIGREQGEIVFPSDGFLSRAHARVRMAVQENEMLVMLEDLGSANGTYLRIRGEGERGVAAPYGTMFRVGDQIFRVRHD